MKQQHAAAGGYQEEENRRAAQYMPPTWTQDYNNRTARLPSGEELTSQGTSFGDYQKEMEDDANRMRYGFSNSSRSGSFGFPNELGGSNSPFATFGGGGAGLSASQHAPANAASNPRTPPTDLRYGAAGLPPRPVTIKRPPSREKTDEIEDVGGMIASLNMDQWKAPKPGAAEFQSKTPEFAKAPGAKAVTPPKSPLNA
jgi:hypothetical protein